jgi:hypothetical protein
MYVLVRRDLSKSQQAVQGGHALAEFILNCQTPWNNSTLVYLGVNRFQLWSWREKLKELKIKFAEWKEPDMQNETTAIAAYSNDKIFKRLNLL